MPFPLQVAPELLCFCKSAQSYQVNSDVLGRTLIEVGLVKKFLAIGFILLLTHAALAEPVTDDDKSPTEVFTHDLTLPSPKLEPGAADLSPSWASFQPQQSFRFTGAKMPGVPAGTATITINLRGLVDWSALAALNRQAQHTWSAILGCTGGNSLQARDEYASKNLCPGGAEAVNEFRSSIRSFLSTTLVQPFSLEKMLKCHLERKKNTFYTYPDICDRFETFEYDHHGEAFSSSPGNFLTVQADHFLDLVQMPQFHPLLIQALLEEAIEGVPLPSVQYNCTGILDCGADAVTLMIPHRVIVPSKYVRFFEGEMQPDYIEQDKNDGWSDAAKELADPAGYIPQLTVSEMSSPRLVDFRNMIIAFRILRIATFGTQHAEDWGLWPKEVPEVLNTASWAGNVYQNANAAPILNRFRRVQKFTGRQYPDGTEGGIEMLERAGAWRRLPISSGLNK